MKYVNKIVEKKPIIHCITNIVTVNDCANILLAIGASPVMAHHPMEVKEITSGSDGLVLNMGALEDYEAMINAGEESSRLGHPIVIDPVGVAGSSYRREKCIELIDIVKPDCIRGNYNEILALIENKNTARGVDATYDAAQKNSADNGNILVEKMRKYASEHKLTVVASGATDIITDGKNTEYVDAGDKMMSLITGSGCMSSVIQAAFLAVENSMEATIAGCKYMGEAGERAAALVKEKNGGTMSFRDCFIDEIYKMRSRNKNKDSGNNSHMKGIVNSV